MVQVTPLLLPNLPLLLILLSSFKSHRHLDTKGANETWCHNHEPRNQPELALLITGNGRVTMSSMQMGFLLLPQTEGFKTRQHKLREVDKKKGPKEVVAWCQPSRPVPGAGPAVSTGSVPGAHPHSIPFDPGLLSCDSSLWQPLSPWTTPGPEELTPS